MMANLSKKMPSRKEFQDQVDEMICQKTTPRNIKQEFLSNPVKFIEEKYQAFTLKCWKEVSEKYKTDVKKRLTETNLITIFYGLLEKVQIVLDKEPMGEDQLISLLDIIKKLKEEVNDELLLVLNGIKIEPMNVKQMKIFVEKLLSHQIRTSFFDHLNKTSNMSKKDKQFFVSKMKVVVCTEKCPGCNRICGMINEHKLHKCLFGHQMKGFNSAFIQR